MGEPIRELLQAFVLTRNEADFQSLYEKTKSLVWTLSCRVLGNEQDACDAFQSAYLRLLVEIRVGGLSDENYADDNQILYRLAVREARNLSMRHHRLAQ